MRRRVLCCTQKEFPCLCNRNAKCQVTSDGGQIRRRPSTSADVPSMTMLGRPGAFHIGRRAVLRVIRPISTTPAPTFDLEAIRIEIIAEHSLANTATTAPITSPSASPPPSALYDSPSAQWHWLDRELSSNVAGETGAVCIYDGASSALAIRASMPNFAQTLLSPPQQATLDFVDEHRAAEQSHLDLFNELLPTHKHTRLLPMWRLAGFALGFAPALVSDKWLFRTVEAVETFVEEHYGEQIGPLRAHGRCPLLVELLEHCCADEVHHKEDAAERSGGTPASLERAWMVVVRVGSAVAAELARRV